MFIANDETLLIFILIFVHFIFVKSVQIHVKKIYFNLDLDLFLKTHQFSIVQLML